MLSFGLSLNSTVHIQLGLNHHFWAFLMVTVYLESSILPGQIPRGDPGRGLLMELPGDK